MIGSSNFDKTKITNNKVSKTIKKVINANSENPEIVEETVYYNKDDVEKFENFEKQDFGIDAGANDVKKNVTIKEDENGTITKVVNIEYSLLEDDINNEGDAIIETSYLNEGDYIVDANGEKSFITNMDSIIMDETGGISFIEKPENIPRFNTTSVITTSQNNQGTQPEEENKAIETAIKTVIKGEKIVENEEDNVNTSANVNANTSISEHVKSILVLSEKDGN